MRRDVMMEMSLEELDQYARVLGIDATGRASKAAKVDLIEERRGRVAEVDALGMTISVPVRRLHDKRVSDRLASGPLTDEGTDELFRDLVGEEQHAAVLERCTDEDGVVDVEAYGVAVARVLTSPALKNF